jgi:hypothetical protein
MKSKPLLALIFLLTSLLFSQHALAQDEPVLQLRLSRDNGYGLGNQMQGNFSYRVSGPDDLVRVEFLMDGEVIGEATEEPFRLNFVTDDFDLGRHEMSAVGFTVDGDRLESNTFIGEFVSPEVTNRFVFVVVGFAVVVFVARFLFFRQGSGQTKQGYGMFGGAVCSKCKRPFARHWWGLNLLTTKFDRCPHCGKWQGTRVATAEELAAAETYERELTLGKPAPAENGLNADEKLRKKLEDSRYEDL